MSAISPNSFNFDNRLFFSATQRNRDFIWDVLSRVIKNMDQYWKLEVLAVKMEYFFQKDIISMPANNFSIIYRKVS